MSYNLHKGSFFFGLFKRGMSWTNVINSNETKHSVLCCFKALSRARPSAVIFWVGRQEKWRVSTWHLVWCDNQTTLRVHLSSSRMDCCSFTPKQGRGGPAHHLSPGSGVMNRVNWMYSLIMERTKSQPEPFVKVSPPPPPLLPAALRAVFSHKSEVESAD